MSRQIRTLIIGAVLCIVLAAASFVVSVPYVVLGVGSTCNTLSNCPPYAPDDIIKVSGTTVAKTSGNLNLTTVSVRTGRTTLVTAIAGWLAHDKVVVPHDSVYPPGQSQKEVDQAETQQFSSSQDSATAAAACLLKYAKGFGVVAVAADSPNVGVLKAGDKFISLGGQPVTDDTGLVKALTGLKQGASVTAQVVRATTPGGASLPATTVTLKLGAPATGSTTPRLGITVANACLMPVQVSLAIGGIGGPSAGLMFALGIVDKIGTTDLTHGQFIAGTGTIDATGQVGAIGGIQLKMLGARRKGATVFLAPASNCADVRGNIPKGLNVIAVSSLEGAVTALAALHAGQDVPRC